MRKLHNKLSKRMACRRKMIRKAAEVKRKLRREVKKKAKLNRNPKHPGVPNSLPFKEEILHEAEQRQQRADDLRAAQKESRIKLQMQNRGVEDLVIEAMIKDIKFEKENPPSSIGKRVLKSSSQNFKSYPKEFKNIESADVILEVLDARDPLGSRCPQVEELVISSGKKLVLVLNKIDLIPKSNLEAWLSYLRQELPTVAFKACTYQPQNYHSRSKLAARTISESLESSRLCFGSSFLMKVLGNYCRNQNIQTFIKVGVVGFPNVGKRSVINSLKCTQSGSIGAMPGVTKTVQGLCLDKHIKILDSPGVVFAKDGSPTTLALRNVVRVEKLKEVIEPVKAIVQRVGHTQLCSHYSVPEFFSCHDLLCHMAKRMGKYKKGGELDFNEGAKRLINDWNRGIIKFYTHPPEQYKPYVHISAEYVAEMGKAFDISSDEEKMEFDNAPSVLPSQAFVAKSVEPTEGLIPDAEDEVEKMDAEDSILQNKMTVELDAKNKITKHDIKRMARKRYKLRRKQTKITGQLSESVGSALKL